MINLIAFLTMLLDHICQIYFPDIERFNVIGRLSFPLFAYGIAKGFKYTQNFKLYALRLMIVAIVSQFPYYLLFESDYLNVCFGLLIGLFVLKLYESKYNNFIKYIMIFFLFILAHVINVEYGIYGVSLIMIFHVFKNKYVIFFMQLFVTVFGIIEYDYYAIQSVSVLALPLLLCLEKYDFKINRIIKYSFYPVHILIIWIFTLIIPVK